MQRAFFVTGTDTGVGKTLVAAGLLLAGRERGWRTAGLKPVAAGCAATPSGLRNDDALLLHALSTAPLSYRDVNPVAFEPAIAPHIAARRAGVEIDAAALVVEGAGGWLVPLNGTETLADIGAQLGFPVILVVGIRLGCLNHALATASLVTARGLQLAGWVANGLDADMQAGADNVEALCERLDAPCLAQFGHLGARPEPEAVAARLATGLLFR